MSDTARTVLAGLGSVRSDLEDLYQDLHRHPELGLREHRTAKKAAESLRRSGYDVTEGVGGTGVIGVLANGDGPVVMARADMDALPVRERTGLPYASTATVTDEDGREQPVMHACGHDVHVTSLVGCARLLAGHRDDWRGTFVALFQPSEENGAGARAMVEDGLTDRSPRPDVVLAQHVLPYPAGYVGTRSGSFLSAADSLRVTVHGRGAHGSAPQASVDPVVIAASVVVRLQTVVSRELAATTPAVVTVGSIHAGSGPNVIPDRAVLELTSARTTTPPAPRSWTRSSASSGPSARRPAPPGNRSSSGSRPSRPPSTTRSRPGASRRRSACTSATTRTPSSCRPPART